ncbi:MAG: hypothetical protein KC502_12480 [Myxococcales bacterium]|nr:hypothetical protein [Myxococcales bacterium]
MLRLACVDLPALPLQLLLQQHPAWISEPAAVVADDRPQGRILHINRVAREHRVLPGMSYAAGLSLAAGLRARVVSPERVSAAVADLTTILRTFSPHVEPSEDEPGVFWVDVSGLERLHPNLQTWAREVHGELRSADFWPRIVVGFSRFSTYALARGGAAAGASERAAQTGRSPPFIQVFDSSEREADAASLVPLARLSLTPKVRDALDKLAVRTVGDLLALPADGVRRRFGVEALQLWRLASGDWRPKMHPEAALVPLRRVMHLDHPMRNSTKLLFIIKRMLPGLLAALAKRRQVLSALDLELRLEGGKILEERVQPAEPTLDEYMLLDLVRLRLDSLKLPAVVEDLALDGEGLVANREQLQMYFERARRDLRAGAQALARLRAEFGEGAVVRITPARGHLPEARYRLEPAEVIQLPEPQEVSKRTLVRRILKRPERLPPQPRHVRDDGWLVRGLAHGSAKRSYGPYIVSGGWWVREVHREYQFTELQSGQLLWLFYDRVRRRWFMHGEVD